MDRKLANAVGLCAAVAVALGAVLWWRLDRTGGGPKGTPMVSVRSETSVEGGARGLPGRRLTVHYEIFVAKDGKPDRKVDSSRDRSTPFEFLLGTGQVFPGWDAAIEGMAVGARRSVLVPSALAYGERGAGDIVKPGEDLVLDVEVLKVE